MLHLNGRGVLQFLGSTRWRAAGITLLFFMGVTAVFERSQLAAMAAQWHSSTFSHGYLILPASLYVIWKRRKNVIALTPTPSMWAIPLLILATFGWLLGNLTTTAVVEQFCAVLFLIGLAWGVLGTAVFRRLLFPLAFLIFAVPFRQGPLSGLQGFSSRFSIKMLSLSQIPAFLE